MPMQPYFTSDALVSVLNSLGATGYYESVGGVNVFTPANWQSAVNYVSVQINTLLDDDDPENDFTAFDYQDILDAGYGVLYWSTEGHFWY